MHKSNVAAQLHGSINTPTLSTRRLLDGVAMSVPHRSTKQPATSSPRNDLVKNYRVTPTHWLICAQISTIARYMDIKAITTLKDRTSAGVFWEMGVSSSSEPLSTLSAVRVAS